MYVCIYLYKKIRKVFVKFIISQKVAQKVVLLFVAITLSHFTFYYITTLYSSHKRLKFIVFRLKAWWATENYSKQVWLGQWIGQMFGGEWVRCASACVCVCIAH